MLAESAAGELIASEIEIRSGRAETLRRGGGAPARAPGAACSGSPTGWAGAGGDGHPSVGQLPRPADHRHAALPAPARATSAGSPSATTPGACTSTWACAAPTARSPSATACAAAAAAARGLRELALPRPPRHRPALGPHARSSPARSRAAGSTSRSATGHAYADFVELLARDRLDRRVDAALVERPPAPPLRHGRGADLRRADARRGVVRAGRADRRLHRPGGARLRRGRLLPAPLRQREIEENLWRAIRYGLDGRDDRLRARRGGADPGGGRAAARVDRAGARRARPRGRAPGAKRRQRARAAARRRARRSRRSTATPSRTTRASYAPERVRG